MGNKDAGNGARKTNSDTMSEDDERLAAATDLIRAERSIALRALAGQLAHQMRNPLAAIHAACSSLRDELDDEDHQQRLEMTLSEINRLLQLVTGMVNTVSTKPERTRNLHLVDEIHCVVEVAHSSIPALEGVEVIGGSGIHCALPRKTFRAALFSLLEHIADTYRPTPLRIELRLTDRRAQIDFRVTDESGDDETTSFHQTTLVRSSDTRSIGLMVAERFARDNGGRLAHTVDANDSEALTLDLPCTDV